MLKINYKAALIFAIFISFSRAENIPDINSTLKGENLGEFFSESIEQNGSIVYSKGKVVFRYDGNTFIANHATYNRDSGRVELKGDVVIFTNRGNKIYADSLIVETHKENLTTLLNMFEVDPQDFWIYSKVAKKIKDVYHFKNTLFSSCNINSPDWSLIFNRAKYDLKSKYLKLYGAKFYIKKMPLFYFPYLAFSLSKERRSGFLYPKYGYKSRDGFYYMQPYYWAISINQDLEFDPVIYSKRGYGLYINYRFVDSPHSKGYLKFGFFKDKNSYTTKYNLKHKEHYGIEFLYKNDALFNFLTKRGWENKLYINSIYFNDLDYLKLQLLNKYSHYTLGRLYESRVNYFQRKDWLYFGLYWKYFKDSSKDSDSSTLHLLPELELHIPYTTFLDNFFATSLNIKVRNYVRKEGSSALESEINLPLEFHMPLFGDYLNLSIEERIFLSNTSFYDVDISPKHQSYILTSHTIKLYSDLAKRYKSGIHTMMFDLTYTKHNITTQSGMDFYDLPQDLRDQFLYEPPFKERISFGMRHFWKSFDNSLNIDYLVRLNYYPKDREKKLRDLKQELNIKYGPWGFYSKLSYSFLANEIAELTNRISYNKDPYSFSLSYLLRRDYLSYETKTKEINFKASYRYSDALRFHASLDYDILKHNLKKWEVGLKYDRKCWNVDFTISQTKTPILTKDGISSITNTSFKVWFVLVPLGGFGGGNM